MQLVSFVKFLVMVDTGKARGEIDRIGAGRTLWVVELEPQNECWLQKEQLL